VSSVPTSHDVVLVPVDNVRLVELCGPLDEHLHQIEARLGVEIGRRGNRFQIVGLPAAAERAGTLLQDLYARAQREPVDSERVHLALQELGMGEVPPGTPQRRTRSRCARHAARCGPAARIRPSI
jgi:phosphate starvation-inducible PhoH-like protein